MSEETQTPDTVSEAAETEALAVSAEALPEGGLFVELDGFEGPIDLLLSMAREQKLDLATIPILPLAEQYLAFIESAQKLRLEIAADYLVMAAWLAYLKSALLLPEEPTAEPSTEEMAAALRFQLMRLEAMQKAAQTLLALPQLGSDFFVRGLPEEREVEERPVYYLPLHGLLSALAAPARRRKPEQYEVKVNRLFTLEESARRLRRILGAVPNWRVLQDYLPDLSSEAEVLEARSAIASTFAATLELVKLGEAELRQDGTFAPIYLRSRKKQDPAEVSESNEDQNEWSN